MSGTPIPPHWVRPLAVLGIIVCGAWTLADLSFGLYKGAAMSQFWQSKKSRVMMPRELLSGMSS